MSLKFSDGMEFDTSGDYRIVEKFDGLYVVGNGMLLPMDSREECNEFINNRKEIKNVRGYRL